MATSVMPQGVPRGVALYMALVQFLFVTTWSVYVIFLPRLLESAGLSVAWVPVLLMVDQLVFMAMDIYVGVAADRAQRTLGRVGPMIVTLTAISCVAFLLLPFAAGSGGAAPALLLSLTFVWAVTSSALRAPPWVLLGKYTATPSVPHMNALMLWGLAAGSALAPYLTVVLKNSDARLPFVLSSFALLAATAGIIFVERTLKLRPVAANADAVQAADRTGLRVTYLIALALLALGFQLHYSVNSAPRYLKLAPQDALQWLMPVFWIGFAIAMVPGGALCKRFGTLRVMAVAAVLGAFAVVTCAHAASLATMVVAQAIAGATWGCMLNSAFSAAMAAGRGEDGRAAKEGYALGLMFAVLAAAVLGRLALVTSGIAKDPAWMSALAWLPAACWAAAGVTITALGYSKNNNKIK